MPYSSIKEIAEELHSGLITPTELVADTLDRIDATDSEIQAFITVMREQAMHDADQAERELRTGLYRSPLHGIPIAVKDLIAVKGVPTTAGSRVLANNISQEDATVVELLRKSGAIIIGKTWTFEFAYGPYSPPTRNPWNHAHTTGGSSGGSAAAVAAGMCPGAIGSDTGGSVRVPSACCGITGLKPTYGRVSCYGVIPLSWSLDHVGPMGRSAEDCALIFDAIAKYDPRDPNSVSSPAGRDSSTAALIEGPEGRGPLSLQNIKLGIPQESFYAPLDPQVRQAWKAALHVLEEEGAKLIDVELPRPTMDLYRTVQRPEATLTHLQKGWLTERLDLYGDTARNSLLIGRDIPAIDYLRAQQERRVFASSLRAIMQRVDAFVLPTLPIPAPLAAQQGQEIQVDGVTENATVALLRLTMPFNLAGLPAVSLPCGFSTQGLPIGMQIAGKPFEEATVLRIAHAYQQLTDWHRKEPAI